MTAGGSHDLYATLKDRVDVIERPHNTFYGMREFIIRDCNRFWLTFGEPVVFGAPWEESRPAVPISGRIQLAA